MKTPLSIFYPPHLLRLLFAGVALSAGLATAQDAAPNARDLASRLNAGIQDGASAVRLKMEIQQPGGGKTVLQLQVKARRTAAMTEVLYQVLWPKERKGEGVLLGKGTGRAPSGSRFVPPASLTPITGPGMKEPAFGSDLSYEDLLENFFAWDQQAVVGTETVDRVSCVILESKPSSGDRSSYARVRSWIDTKRLVPLRVEKYVASGQMARRITTTRVAKDDTGRPVPASFMVQRSGDASTTELEGSNSRHDVVYTDSDFTPEALQRLSPAK